jgi:hypothetical protein
MTVIIQIPGTLSSTAGLERLMPTNNGFPSEGLTDLLMLQEGAGTAPANAVAGSGAGAIEAPAAVNNAFAWLGGGGVQLDGTQIISLPARDASAPWTLVSLGSVTGSVGGTASERLCGLLGFKEFPGVSPRGAGLYLRGGNDWNIPAAPPFFQHRGTTNGANNTAENLLPSSGLGVIGSRHVRVFSYNGVDTITSTIYDKNASVIAEDSAAATDAGMFTVAGVTVTNLTPCAGLSHATYSGGRQQVEALARYSRVLGAADISRICAAASAIGATRGRAW